MSVTVENSEWNEWEEPICKVYCRDFEDYRKVIIHAEKLGYRFIKTGFNETDVYYTLSALFLYFTLTNCWDKVDNNIKRIHSFEEFKMIPCKELYVSEFLALPITKRTFNIKSGDVVLVRDSDSDLWSLAIFNYRFIGGFSVNLSNGLNQYFKYIVKYNFCSMNYVGSKRDIPNAFNYNDDNFDYTS